jgi:hypothetical protein
MKRLLIKKITKVITTTPGLEYHQDHITRLSNLSTIQLTKVLKSVNKL